MRHMTEGQIEAIVERRMDALDARYLAGEITDEDYRQRARDLDLWAEEKLADVPAPMPARAWQEARA